MNSKEKEKENAALQTQIEKLHEELSAFKSESDSATLLIQSKEKELEDKFEIE